MILLSKEATSKEILGLVHRWVNLLADEKYEQAYKLTDHDDYYKWTPRLIQAVIEGYGLPEPRENGVVFKVTPIETAKGEKPPCHEVNFLDTSKNDEEKCEMIIGDVWFDLPLSGKWSDLTATFQIRQNLEHTFLVLNEIHVF